jgi:hypothetical protein
MAEILVEKDEGNSEKVSNNNYVPGKPYSKLGRELTDEDLRNPAVQKLLLNEIDKLEIIQAKYEDLQNNFHIVDKEKSILEEKLKVNASNEIIYSFCLAAGSAILSLATLSQLQGLWWIFVVVGSILIIGGILSKFIRWK